ncbi:MAG: histidinol phosphatase [Flavobacterium sp.]|nr:MAG: histidinol phosphatase [Flavobacterium sp.]
MFFFTKPKPSLADLIPPDYVDIHSHLLPGIDDGAKQPADTIALIKGLKDYGFSQFITTPHILTGVWNNTHEGIKKVYESTETILKNEGMQMPFRAAAEYLMDDTFLKLLKTAPLLTIKDNHVLVEMSYINPPMQLYDIIFQLQIEGYKPILAHPERYLFYHQKFEEYSKLKNAGCLFQINLLSATGYYGKEVANVSQKLLDNNMIDFAGSDVHHQRHVDSFKNKVLLKNTDALVAALNKNSLFKI